MAKLTRRKGKNNWEIQYPLPSKLRPLLGTPAIYRSLGTPDKSEARRRFPMKHAEVHAEVVALIAKHFPDDDDAVFSELRDLIDAIRRADDSSEPGEDSERSLLIDAARAWGDRHRQARLQPYRGTAEEGRQRRGADELKERADQLVLDAVQNRVRIADLVGSWRKDVKPRLAQSTQEEYERTIQRFNGWCVENGITSLDQVDRKSVREFVDACFHGRMGRTVKLALGAMRGVWDHAYTAGLIDERSRVWLDHSYADGVRIGTGERREDGAAELPFTMDDLRQLLAKVAPGPFCDLFRLGLVTGARSSELTSLRPEDILKKSDGYWLQVSGTKTRSARRTVPIPAAFTRLGDRLISEARGEHLLCFYPERVWNSARDRNRYINKELNRKRRDLRLPDGEKKGVHSTRRTYLELLEGAGVSLDTAKLLVGHKRSDITFGLYSKGAHVDLRGAVEKLRYPDDIVELINGGPAKPPAKRDR